MRKQPKGVSTIISYVLIIAISIAAISIAYLVAVRVINQALDAAVVNEATANANKLSDAINEVSREGVGGKRTLELQVTGGGYSVNSSTGQLYFEYGLASNIFPSKMYMRSGNIRVLTCPVGNNINYELRLVYNKINLTGDGNTIGKGTSSVCVQKAGLSGANPLVNVSRC